MGEIQQILTHDVIPFHSVSELKHELTCSSPPSTFTGVNWSKLYCANALQRERERELLSTLNTVELKIFVYMTHADCVCALWV